MSSLERYRNDISRCVRCGACSTVCPSFLADRRESRSPRGRMALIEAVLEGKLCVSDVYKDRLATCTGCMACESACASGVPFSTVIQAAKEQAIQETGPGIVAGLVSGALKHPVLMRSLAWLAPVALHYGKGSVRGHGKADRGTGRRGDRGKEKNDKATGRHGDGSKKQRGRVAFFPGCAVNYFQPDIGDATAGLLAALGYDVVIPDGLKCCGRPYLSLGDRAAAEDLARKNVDILSSLDVEAIVTACASCGLTFKKEYPALLAPSGSEQVRVLDIHEFLSDKVAGLDLRPLNAQVTWHDPCHLGRGQGLAQTARDVLRSIPGIELVEMKDPGQCCGFGGVMRISHPSLSGTIGDKKARNVIATQASVVVTGCPGCRMQIADSLRRAGSDVEVVHSVQVIAGALRIADCGLGIADLESTAGSKTRG
jgi:glycolate oxidase iron-sulfur subunit